MRLGISSYTYVWSVGVPGYPPPRPMTAKALLEKAVELGVPVVQIADNLPLDRLSAAERQSLRTFACEHGIAVEVGTRGIEPENLRRYLRLAREFGSPILRTVIDTPARQPSEADVVETLGPLLTEFRAAGVRLAIENHDRFRAAVLLRILDCLGTDCAGICLDTANSLGCGEGIEQVLETLATRVLNLHIKDFTVGRPPHNKGFIIEGCPAGCGLVDVPALLAKLRRAGQDPSAILELWPPPEPTLAASIEKEQVWALESVRYLRRLIPE